MKKSILLILTIFCISALNLSAKTIENGNPKTAQSLFKYTADNIQSITPELLKSELKSLNLKEQKKFFVLLYKKVIDANKNKVEVDPIVLYILAVVLPPVAVGLYTNWEPEPTIINLALTCVLYLPGIVHAFYIITK
jgi:uncharacterized membrane protein YqaE (UPF0057 family)